MIDIEVNCEKIKEYLTSFLADGKGNKSLEKVSDSEVSELPNFKLSLIGNNESRKLNIKTCTAPNNVEEFHRRLKSFECGLWTCTTISPLLCATYGWRLINKDILSCVTCKAMVCTILPLPNQIEAYNVFSGKLKQRLKTGHKDWCEWPNNPTPSEYLHPPFHMTVHYANNLVRKASNLLALGNRIPYLNCEEILKKLGLEIKEVSRFFNIEPELSENHLNAAVLILCGWEYESKEKLRCNLCFRSIGVWNFLELSEGRHYEELERKSREREEKRKVIEEKKKHRERRLLIQEEKLKAKLLEEKKAALAEMEAEEKALKVKLALEKMSKLENSDLSNPSDEDDEEEEEMGEEEENLLLNEEGTNELIMEEEENIISEPGFTVDTSPENNALSDADSSHSSEHLPEAEETVGSKTHDAILDTESERNLESDEGSKSCNGNESDDDLWLEAVGGYVEESQSNMPKPVYSPLSEESENSLNYPTDNTNFSRHRSASSEDESSVNYSTDNKNRKTHRSGSFEDESSVDYPSDNTNSKRRRSESSENENNGDYPIDNTYSKRHRNGSSENENSVHYPTVNANLKRCSSGSSEDENSIDYPTDNSNRKRRRSESSEDEYVEEEIATKCRKVEDCETQNIQSGSNEDSSYNVSSVNSNSCDVNENPTGDINNENVPVHSEAQDSNIENIEEEEEMDEEEIEDNDDDDPEEIAIINKMRNSLFQPLEQHRHWCGWVVDHSSLYIDKIDTSVEGFKIIPPQISQLQPDLPDSSIVTSEKYAGNIVGLRTVRGILESWARDQTEDLQELE